MTYEDPRATADLHRLRAEAMEIRCDYCHADPGHGCRNRITGEPLIRQPAHLQRMRGVSI